MTKPLIAVTTAPWLTERQPLVDRLRAQLEPECKAAGVTLMFWPGTDRSSHVPNYTAAIARAVELAQFAGDVTHITLLPDDAILVPHFVEVLSRLIEQRPDDHLCLLSNHPKARAAFDQGAVGYTTTLGSVLFGGTLRVQEWAAYLQWRKDVLLDDAAVPFDNGVNLWLATQGRSTFKPLPSLCDHDTSLESTLGNQWQENDPEQRVFRHSQVFHADADLRMVDWRGEWDGEGMGHMVESARPLGATFPGQAWDLATKVKPEAWAIEAMYTAARGGKPVDPKGVMLATPSYRGMVPAMEQSREVVQWDLANHGWHPHPYSTVGDSLVTRGRHDLVNEFMQSDCAYLLMWDDDIEVEHPGCLRLMLESGHDVIGGAYPFRDGSGNVVANRMPGIVTIVDGCIPVKEVGTGFLLISRAAIVKLCMANPDRFYVSDLMHAKGVPMWALFDTRIVNRRYLSEDYDFCQLWRDAGGTVYVYGPAGFKHWGMMPSSGHVIDAWGLKKAEAAE